MSIGVKTFVILLFGVVNSVAASEARNLADQCVKAIQRIQSYDIVMDVGRFSVMYDKRDPASGEAGRTFEYSCHIHDMTALRLGRRFEFQPEDDANRSIFVKNWDGESKGSQSLADFVPGMNFEYQYSTYYNPAFFTNRMEEGFPTARLLDDILRDPATSIKSSDPASSAGLLGIWVDHPKLLGPIQVWIDPGHGYLPAKIEKYGRYHSPGGRAGKANRETLLDTVIQVEQFASTAENIWVPVKAAYLTMQSPGADGQVTTRDGYVATVDVSKSSWNSIRSDEAFREASLPTVNREEKGWKQYYAPERLAKVNAFDVAEKRLLSEMRGSTSPASFTRLMLLLVNGVVIAVVVWLLIRRRHRQTFAV